MLFNKNKSVDVNGATKTSSQRSKFILVAIAGIALIGGAVALKAMSAKKEAPKKPRTRFLSSLKAIWRF